MTVCVCVCAAAPGWGDRQGLLRELIDPFPLSLFSLPLSSLPAPSSIYVYTKHRLTDLSIDGADFTDTLLRKDQQSYLCKRATGVNKRTGVATRDSLLCP